MDEGDQPLGDGGELAALEPAHLAAFRAFARAAGLADTAVASEPTASPHPAPGLNPRLARRVYEGQRGKLYIVPGPGSLCYVSIAAGSGETVIGHTSTELAARDGLGHVGSVGAGSTTFVGVLPAGGHDLRIINRADHEIRVRLTPDDAYWVTVIDPIDAIWTGFDGDDRHIFLFGHAGI